MARAFGARPGEEAWSDVATDTERGEVAEELSADERSVREWRRDQFRRLGFGDAESDLLAECGDVDLGRVRSLAAAGCERATLLRIVL